MKHHGVTLAVGLVGMTIVATTTCDKPPVEQLEVGISAIEAARSAGAPDYAKEDFASADRKRTGGDWSRYGG
jgi:uncharacterized protein YqhQ